MKRELPDDLARLGVYLEVAAGETVRRRRRRQAMANFIGVVSLAVPFALAVAAADLSPADGLFPQRPRPVSLEVQPSTTAFVIRRDPIPPPTKDPCVNAHDCRAPVSSSVRSAAPAGKR